MGLLIDRPSGLRAICVTLLLMLLASSKLAYGQAEYSPFCKVLINAPTRISAYCDMRSTSESQNNTDELGITAFLGSMPSGIKLYISDPRDEFEDDLLILTSKFCDLSKGAISYKSSIVCIKI